jgi:hypothetical protein
VSDEYTYCVYGQNAQACITSSHPMTEAEVRSHVSITPQNEYNEVFTQPVPQDQPWYLDAFDAVTNWFTDQTVMGLGGLAVALVAVILLVRYVRLSDMAPDAYEAEDYIEDLNDEAYDRMYDEEYYE